jgi:pimeloyl-ACP methyl ester carboxylesterase
VSAPAASIASSPCFTADLGPKMATYALIHGAGDVGWYWHLVEAELRDRGHDTVAPDLPCEDESAGWSDYADAVVDAFGGRSDLVVVAQSLGGFTAPIVCDRVPVALVVFVAGMVPLPGETANDWAKSTWEETVSDPPTYDDEIALFYHDVPPELAAEALRRGRGQAERPMREPWPLETLPDVPVRYLLCRDDRVFPAEFVRLMVKERLGIDPDEIDGGHTPALSRPKELAARLEAFRRELGAGGAPRNHGWAGG